MNLPSVNRRQMALYVFFVPFVFKVVMLPGYLARGAGRDAWLSVALLLAIELAELALILLIHRAGGLSAFREKAGTVLSNIVLVPLLFAFGAKTIVYLSEAINYITAYLFYNITNLSVGNISFSAGSPVSTYFSLFIVLSLMFEDVTKEHFACVRALPMGIGFPPSPFKRFSIKYVLRYLLRVE